MDVFSNIKGTNPTTLFVSASTVLVLLLHDFAIKVHIIFDVLDCLRCTNAFSFCMWISAECSQTMQISSAYSIDCCRTGYSFVLCIRFRECIRCKSCWFYSTRVNNHFSFINIKSYLVKTMFFIRLPAPRLPSVQLMPSLILDALILAIVGYSISLSMAQLYAHKLHYPLSGSVQLCTEGLSNVVASFFNCIPAAGSMARSIVLVSVGGKTQLSGLVSGLVLVLVVLFIGPVFQSLPKAVLSSIIVVALKGMFTQTLDFEQFFKKSKLDGLLWLGTFVGVILTNVDVGLLIAVALTVFVMACRSYDMKVVTKEDFRCPSNDDKCVLLSLTGVLTFANVEATLKKCTWALQSKKADSSNADAAVRNVNQIIFTSFSTLKNLVF